MIYINLNNTFLKSYIKQIFLLLAVLIYYPLSAQNQNIEGIVLNKISKQPVANVIIQILPDNKFGTITNESGKFSLHINKNKTVLRFSHIAFETKLVTINRKSLSDTGLVILLLPKSYSLDEVVIKDNKFQTVYKNHNQAVIDYAIYRNRIFFLVRDYSENKTKILSVNKNLKDTLFIHSPCRPKKLLIDFYGNLDVISKKDSVYQIIPLTNSVYFKEPIHYDKLSKLHELYDFMIDDKYYFSEFESILKDKIDYGYVDTINNKEVIFYTIFDDNKVNYYYNVMKFKGIIYKNYKIPPGEKRRRIVLKYYNSNGLYLDRLWFYNNISNIYFHINDTIYIIDNITNKLTKLDKNGKIISEIEIVCNNNDDKICNLLKREGGRIWKNKILQDKHNDEKVYFIWKEGNKTELYDLNVKNGEVSFVKILPHLFPEKIMIDNGEIYYLYQKPGNLRSYGLYRTQLIN